MEQIATQYKLERMLLHKCARPAGPQEGPEQNTQVLGKWGGGEGGRDTDGLGFLSRGENKCCGPHVCARRVPEM